MSLVFKIIFLRDGSKLDTAGLLDVYARMDLSSEALFFPTIPTFPKVCTLVEAFWYASSNSRRVSNLLYALKVVCWQVFGAVLNFLFFSCRTV